MSLKQPIRWTAQLPYVFAALVVAAAGLAATALRSGKENEFFGALAVAAVLTPIVAWSARQDRRENTEQVDAPDPDALRQAARAGRTRGAKTLLIVAALSGFAAAVPGLGTWSMLVLFPTTGFLLVRTIGLAVERRREARSGPVVLAPHPAPEPPPDLPPQIAAMRRPALPGTAGPFYAIALAGFCLSAILSLAFAGPAESAATVTAVLGLIAGIVYDRWRARAVAKALRTPESLPVVVFHIEPTTMPVWRIFTRWGHVPVIFALLTHSAPETAIGLAAAAAFAAGGYGSSLASLPGLRRVERATGGVVLVDARARPQTAVLVMPEAQPEGRPDIAAAAR